MDLYSYRRFNSDDLADGSAWEVGKLIDGEWDRVAVAQTETLAEKLVSALNTPAPQPTRASKWISTADIPEGLESLYFVMIDTERDPQDLEGPYGSIKDAQDAAETINYETELWKMVPVETREIHAAEVARGANADSAAWGAFYDTDPRGKSVVKLREMLEGSGVCEVTGALIKALEEIADDPQDFQGQNPEDNEKEVAYLRETRRRLLEALGK